MFLRTPLALALLLAPAPLLAQAVVQPIGVSDADALAEQVRRLGANPLDTEALLPAAELSVRLGDLSAAGSFLARAEKVAPAGGRGAAIRGAILVRSERPGEALRQFASAETQGFAAARFASDRGLAYDLTGDQPRAQRDYRTALSAGGNDETRRRYALSLAISGKQREALDELAPQVRRNDRAGWRTRAFVLAMGGDATEASKIAATMMPPGAAAGLRTFFTELPRLPAIDRAFAVHFGEVRATPQRLADARLAPVLTPLAEPAPVRVAAVAVAPPPQPSKRDKRRRGRDRDFVAQGSVVAAPSTPVQVAAVEPVGPPPAYQAPVYQPQPAYRAADRPLAPGEQASLAAATLKPSQRRGRAAPAVTPPPTAVVATTPARDRPVALAALTPTPTPGPVRLATAEPARTAAPQPSAAAPIIRPTPTVTATVPAERPSAGAALVASPPPVGTAAPLGTASVTPQPLPTVVPAAPQVVASTAPSSAPAVPSTPDAPATTPLASAPPSALAADAVGTSVAPVAAAVTPTPLAPLVTAPPVQAAAVAPPTVRVATAPSTPAPRPDRINRARADDILAKIVANLSIPASELGVGKGPTSGAKLARAAAKIASAEGMAATKPAAGKVARTAKSGFSTAVDEPVPDAPKTAAERKALAAKEGAADKKALADKKAAAEKKELADKAAAEKKAARAEPARIWVQVAGGANEGDLAKAWSSAKAKAPAAFAGRQGYSTPLRATNRVLTGPFKTDAEARAYVNQLAKSGVSAFSFTSEAGQKISKLGAK